MTRTATATDTQQMNRKRRGIYPSHRVCPSPRCSLHSLRQQSSLAQSIKCAHMHTRWMLMMMMMVVEKKQHSIKFRIKLCKQSKINFQQRAERPTSAGLCCCVSIAVQIIKLINKAISGGAHRDYACSFFLFSTSVAVFFFFGFNPVAFAHRSIIGFISSHSSFIVAVFIFFCFCDRIFCVRRADDAETLNAVDANAFALSLTLLFRCSQFCLLAYRLANAHILEGNCAISLQSSTQQRPMTSFNYYFFCSAAVLSIYFLFVVVS